MPAKTPDDYLKEMMELYKRSNSKPQPIPSPKPMQQPVQSPEPMRQPVQSPEPMRQPVQSPEPIQQPVQSPEPIQQPVQSPEPMQQPVQSPEPMQQPIQSPEPMRQPVQSPEPIQQPIPSPEPMQEPASISPGYIPESESMPKPLPLPKLPYEMAYERKNTSKLPSEEETSFGWIQVTARTAGNALPLEGVSVLILKENGMDTELLMSLVTDQSGLTPKVKLPAPPIGNAQAQPYSTYEIRAFLPGYSRMESASVPVFSGITSVQGFELIPLPFGADENSPTIVNQNTEPKF